MSLAALADLAQEEGRSTVDLFYPRVRFRSVNISDLDACLDWFAELTMTVDIDDADDVVVGSLDFTLIRLGTEDPVALCLDQFDGYHEMLAGLFDGNQLTAEVEEQFETMGIAADVVLVPNIAFVTEPLRGHNLGAWLVAETIHRMLPAGIVLMWPYPMASSDSPQIDALDSAITRLSDHFQLCGLTPVESAPWALGMSTAFVALGDARSQLSSVRGTSVSIPLADLRVASTPPAAEA
ncbi:hypothetical protein ACFWAY_50780 [Rhodococcus sp. NPDC059968]|uniref:hypothetical protein n=1 Tax=Rhodococcus sp. NPDC059968 TaxID=3347017 RepID=UPI003670DDC0